MKSWEIISMNADYGNTGCRVFKEGIQDKKSFWLKMSNEINDFENWGHGEQSKIGYHFRG